MVLGGHSRKIIVRGQEYRWVASGKHNGCSWKECRQLTLAIEKRLHPAHSCRTGKGRKSHSAHPSRRRSILLTVTIGYQLLYLGSCPTVEDIVDHMLPRASQLLCGIARIRFDNSLSIPSLRLLAIDAIFSARQKGCPCDSQTALLQRVSSRPDDWPPGSAWLPMG